MFAKVSSMPSDYTIGQLASAASVATSTVRYYERVKLLGPRGRTEGNYRVYGDDALERLRFIRAAQAHGFTLEDVGTMLAFQDGERAPCGEVQSLIERRLDDLDHRIRQLHHLKDVLQSSLRVCHRSRPTARCRVVEEIRSESSGPVGGGARPTRKKIDKTA